MSAEVSGPDAPLGASFASGTTTTVLRWSPVLLSALVAIVAVAIAFGTYVVLLALLGVGLSAVWVRLANAMAGSAAILCLGIATTFATRSSGEDTRLVVMVVAGVLLFGAHATGSWSKVLQHAHVERRAIVRSARSAGLTACASLLGALAALLVDRGVSHRALAALGLAAVAIAFLVTWLASARHERTS